MSLFALILLFLFIWFILLPILRIGWKINTVRRQAGKAFQQMADDRQRAADRQQRDRRQAGWQQGPATDKIFSKTDGEYVEWEDITVTPTETTSSASTSQQSDQTHRTQHFWQRKSSSASTSRITDVDFEDL